MLHRLLHGLHSSLQPFLCLLRLAGFPMLLIVYSPMQFIQIAAKVVGAGVMLAGAVGKTAYFGEFREILTAYGLIPRYLVRPTSLFLLGAEFAAAAGVLVNRTTTVAALLAIGLLIVYSVAIALNLFRGRTSLPCGCGGKGSEPISLSLVIRNGALLGVFLIAVGSLPFLAVALILAYTVAKAFRYATRNRSRLTAKEAL